MGIGWGLYGVQMGVRWGLNGVQMGVRCNLDGVQRTSDGFQKAMHRVCFQCSRPQHRNIDLILLLISRSRPSPQAWLEATDPKVVGRTDPPKVVGRCGLLGRKPPAQACIESVMQQLAPGGASPLFDPSLPIHTLLIHFRVILQA